MEKYQLELNAYGNVTELPEGWKETKLRVNQLKKLGIPSYKWCYGIEQRGHYYKPSLLNIIPIDFSMIENEYIEKLKKNKIEDRGHE